MTASEDDSSPIIMVWDLRNARAPEKVDQCFSNVSCLINAIFRSLPVMIKAFCHYRGVNKTQTSFSLVEKIIVPCAGILRRQRSLARYVIIIIFTLTSQL